MSVHKGRCLCGAARFEATPKRDDRGAINVDACHCRMCRRHVGGPLMAVTVDDLQFADEDAVLVYQSSEWAERGFCKICSSSLFWRLRDGGLVSVHAGEFDDLGDARFSSEIFVDELPGYYAFAGERKTMTGAEVAAAFAMGEEA